MRPVDDKELATSAYKRSELSTLAALLKTVVLLSDDFRVLAAESGWAATTGWNVLRWLPTRLGCCPVSAGGGGAMFSVRRRTVFGLSSWSDILLWLTDDAVAEIWWNRGLSCKELTTPAPAASLCRIWLRSISSKVEAFWWLAISWIPVTAGLIHSQQ